MGFLDKAKKLAEQAQTKLDEVQTQFNEKQGAPSGGPAVEYDQHGRPVARAEAAAPTEPGQAPTPPHGDPLSQAAAPAPPTPPSAPPTPTPDSSAPPAPQAPPAPPSPAGQDERQDAGPDEDRNHPSYAPPKMSSGDPLAG
jgi:hypothetical protein